MTTSRLATVVVTGGAGGIGVELCRAFLAHSERVVSLDVVRCPLSDVASVTCDLSDPSALMDAFSQTPLDGAEISTLINNAAVQRVASFEQLSPEDWGKSLSTNLIAAHRCIVESLPGLRRSKLPTVVNIASVHGQVTSRGMTAYAASKAALLSLTRSAAIELGPEQIRVLSVSPGAVDTPMLRRGLARDTEDGQDSALERLKRRHATRTILLPQEVAAFVRALVLTPGFNITGTDFTIDGAATALLSTEAYS